MYCRRSRVLGEGEQVGKKDNKTKDEVEKPVSNLVMQKMDIGKEGDEERRTGKWVEQDAMSAYENVVGGKLKLKGKALDVKVGGVKKKKKIKKHHDQLSEDIDNELSAGGSASTELSTHLNEEEIEDHNKSTEDGKAPHYDDHLTPAERRYIEQKESIDVHRLAKKANKSHRDRIHDFNQYLANMSEHYDIPKVGPG